MKYKNITTYINPFIYEDIINPNTIDLNLGYTDTQTFLSNDMAGFYRRLAGTPNNRVLRRLFGLLYDLNEMHVQVTSSGMSAILLCALLNKINTVYILDSLYPETPFLFQNLSCKFVKFHDFDMIFDQLSDKDLVVIESLPMPELRMFNLDDIIKKIHSKKAKILVDNTVLTHYFYNPFDFDSDYVIEACGKSVSGFNNAMLGILVSRETNSDINNAQESIKGIIGNAPHDIDAYFTLLGMQLMPLRLERRKENTELISKFLSVIGKDIRYNIEAGLIFIKIKDKLEAEYFVKTTKLFKLEENMGGNISNVTVWRDKSYLRLSIGLEDPKDLINDLERCFIS